MQENCSSYGKGGKKTQKLKTCKLPVLTGLEILVRRLNGCTSQTRTTQPPIVFQSFGHRVFIVSVDVVYRETGNF